MNAFMVFSHLERKKVIASDPKIENTQISKELGRRWKNLSEEERVPYIREADKLREYHQREYPDYKYKPMKKKVRSKHSSSEENTAARKIDTSTAFGSGLRSNKINVSYGGPLRALNPNIPKITINKKFKNSLINIHQKKTFLPLEPLPRAPHRGEAMSDLSPPAKVPYSPQCPTTPDPHSQPFYGSSMTSCYQQPLQYSPQSSRLVPMNPGITRSCPVTPLSRQHSAPRTITKPPSPLFPKQEQFSWDLDSASLPDLTSFLDNFLPNSSSEISLDVGDLKLDFTNDAVEEAVAGAEAAGDVIKTDVNSMDVVENIVNDDLFDDHLIDLKLMEFVS